MFRRPQRLNVEFILNVLSQSELLLEGTRMLLGVFSNPSIDDIFDLLLQGLPTSDLMDDASKFRGNVLHEQLHLIGGIIVTARDNRLSMSATQPRHTVISAARVAPHCRSFLFDRSDWIDKGQRLERGLGQSRPLLTLTLVQGFKPL